jgi:adenine-specific DNA-methyltransferase
MRRPTRTITPMQREATSKSDTMSCDMDHFQLDPRALQKKLGQFMTPPAVANYMASRVLQGVHKKVIRILEPSAGSGILAAAIFEYIIAQPKKPEKLEFVLYEIDPSMSQQLSVLANRMRSEARKLGFSVSCSIRLTDFLLSLPEDNFDVVIANPPFFKLRKDDPRSVAHKYVVHGQPNIYGLFMAACAQLLSDSGRYCFLTPRSWTSGSYFSELRRYIFKNLHLEAVHLFQNREATFSNDRIQQEMMITWASVQTSQEDIIVSSSNGMADLGNSASVLVPISNVFQNRKCESVNLPLGLSTYGISAFGNTLETIGLRASTGKVVPFRAIERIVNGESNITVPLLWMQHVRRGAVIWPLVRKREHIECVKESTKLLLPNENYVLVRRFSPRDREHWITAAPLILNTLHKYIGIENHVNYIYGVNSAPTNDETIGLAAYLNSGQVSLYFASRLGHTQINASDLNTLPVPSKDDLYKIGKKWINTAVQCKIDTFIDTILAEIDRKSHESQEHEQRALTKSPV